MRAPLGHPEAGAGRPVARRCPSSGPTGRHRLDHLRRREQAPELSSILEPDGAPTALGPRSGRRPPHPRGVSSRVESGSSAARARRSRPWSPRRRAWRRGAPGPGPTTVPSSMPAPRSRALDGAPPNPNRLGTVPCSVSGSGRRGRSSRGAGRVVGAPSLVPRAEPRESRAQLAWTMWRPRPPGSPATACRLRTGKGVARPEASPAARPTPRRPGLRVRPADPRPRPVRGHIFRRRPVHLDIGRAHVDGRARDRERGRDCRTPLRAERGEPVPYHGPGDPSRSACAPSPPRQGPTRRGTHQARDARVIEAVAPPPGAVPGPVGPEVSEAGRGSGQCGRAVVGPGQPQCAR